MSLGIAKARRAAASVGNPATIPGVTPQASQPIGWRWSAGWSYSVLAFGPGVLGPIDIASWAQARDTVSWDEPLDIAVYVASRDTVKP